MEGEATEEGAGEPVAEDEGPEPARIPTSLTATLREQGGRYPHRVSRRTRRKGRGGDRGPATGRPARSAGRSASDPEQGGEQRTVQGSVPKAVRKGDPTAAGSTGRSASGRPGRGASRGTHGKNPAAFDQRPAEGRAGDHRSDCQGAAGTEGRAHHVAHRAARPLPGVHADGGPHRRLAQDSERRGAHAA